MLSQYNIEFDTKNVNRRGFTCVFFLIVEKGSFENPTPCGIILKGNFVNEFYPEWIARPKKIVLLTNYRPRDSKSNYAFF